MAKRKLYTARQSYFNQAKHFNDVFLNLGNDYVGKILTSGTSPELWANPLQNGNYATIESMITSVLEHAKFVKKWFSIAHDKNITKIN